MKNHLIGFIVSALLHAGIISGVVALNKQPGKKLAPENQLALMVEMFKSEASSHHSVPDAIDDIDLHSDYVVADHFVTPAPLPTPAIKKQLLKPQPKEKLDKKPQPTVNSKPQNSEQNIKKKALKVKKSRQHLVKTFKKPLAKKKTKKKKFKRKPQKIVTKKIIKKTKRPAPKSVLAPAKRKTVRTNIKTKTKVAKHPTKPPLRHYAVRKINPQRQYAGRRKASAFPHKNLQKRKPLRKPPRPHARAYNNRARGAVVRKQARTGSPGAARAKTRTGRKQAVTVKRTTTSNRSQKSLVPQLHKEEYHNKAPSKKVTSVNVQRLNQQYKARLQQIIVSKKSYPRRARRHGQQGKVTLSFSVSHSGTITDIRVLNSSGIPVLDKASIKAIQQASKMLRFFPGMPKKSMKLSITLNYILNSG